MKPLRKKTDVYDSSDSMDSFNMGDPPPKKNTDEMFDELLKSTPSSKRKYFYLVVFADACSM